jgi:CelD/BcsL family acetyltransferase involved in cellulose biosynthesis
VTPPTLDAEPACPDVAAGPERGPRPPVRPLAVTRRSLDELDAATWDALVARTPWATPFSRWAVHRAWWDAYGANAHDDTLVVTEPADGRLVGIAPLMHRHELEPADLLARTALRHEPDADLTPVAPTATAVFFGASYHADYATLLTDPADLPSVADAVVDLLARPVAIDPADRSACPTAWDAVDLRRLRCGDPAADELAAAFLAREALGKKERHEIRRKVRRAEAAGEIRLDPSPDPLADLEAFIDLHQRRWGADGLFPPTPGGDASRRFLHRLFELAGPDGPVHLSFLTVDGRRIAAGIHLEDERAVYYYNAGVDPDARELSPGVVMVARYVAGAIARGVPRFDFLRGDESYKYEWGAVDAPIQRLLVRRASGHATVGGGR